MASPTGFRRAVRAAYEVTGCALIWKFVDSWENWEVLKRIEKRTEPYLRQEKSMLAEYRILYEKIDINCKKAVKGLVKGKNPSDRDVTEFLDSLVMSDEQLRPFPVPRWRAAALESDPKDFQQHLTTVTPEEHVALTRFRATPSSPALLAALDLIAEKDRRQQELDELFGLNLELLAEGIETVDCTRMEPRQALEMESVKAAAKIVLPALFLFVINKYGVYKHWLPFSNTSKKAAPFLKTMLKYVFYLILAVPLGVMHSSIVSDLTRGSLSISLAEYVLQDEISVNSEMPGVRIVSRDAEELIKFLVQDSSRAGPVPLGGSSREPFNEYNLTIYALLRPVTEMMIFCMMLPHSLRAYVGPTAAMLLSSLGGAVYKTSQINYDFTSVSRDMLIIESFLLSCTTLIGTTMLHFRSNYSVLPALLFTLICNGLEAIFMFMRYDTLLRPTWSLTKLVHSLLAYRKKRAYDTYKESNPADSKLRDFAVAIADIYSTDYYSEKTSRTMHMKDIEAMLVGLEHYFKQKNAAAGSLSLLLPFSPFHHEYFLFSKVLDSRNSLLTTILAKEIASKVTPEQQKQLEENRKVYQVELYQVFLDFKTEFLKRIVDSKKGMDMQQFTSFLGFIIKGLKRYNIMGSKVDYDQIIRGLSSWEDTATSEEFLDILQIYYDTILQCDSHAYSRYDEELYHQLEVQLAGRVYPTPAEHNAHLVKMRDNLGLVRAWHVNSCLGSHGLSYGRFAELFKRYSARSQDVKELDKQWRQYFSSDKYRVKNLALAGAVGRSRYFMKSMQRDIEKATEEKEKTKK